MAKKSWHTRGLTSLLTLAGFLVMSITGLILYICPQGRIAYWTDWHLLGLTKTNWGDIHILSSLLFIIAGAFHIYFNWKPLMNYLQDKIRGGLKLKKEIALSTAATILVTLAGIYHIPPLSYLIDLNEAIKEAWVIEKEYEPPFGHAELLSLKVFCKKVEIPYDKAVAELKAKGFVQVEPNLSLAEIAKANKTSPLGLYRVIMKFEGQTAKPDSAPLPDASRLTPQNVEEKFGGTGIGNKTIGELASKIGQDPAKVKSRLEAKGLKVEPGLSLKSLAAKNGLAALELLKAALIEAYQPKK